MTRAGGCEVQERPSAVSTEELIIRHEQDSAVEETAGMLLDWMYNDDCGLAVHGEMEIFEADLSKLWTTGCRNAAPN
jgi:hypothetical protein